MFKRVERKRKRREEDEELGLNQDTMDMNETDTDESGSNSERDSAQLDDSDAGMGKGIDQEENVASEDEEGPPMSVAEALKDPIYLVSLEPTIHGCVLCKGKLIKNTGMATAHRNANAHRRRVGHFRSLSANVNPSSNAWELVKAIRSTTRAEETGLGVLSKRALKRQAKQAAFCEKRKHHKELKAKAIAKKASKKLSVVDETRPAPSAARSQSSQKVQATRTGKKKKVEREIPTIMTSVSPTKVQSGKEKPAHKSKTKSTTETNKVS